MLLAAFLHPGTARAVRKRIAALREAENFLKNFSGACRKTRQNFLLYICRGAILSACKNYFKKCVSFFRIDSLLQVKAPAKPSARPAVRVLSRSSHAGNPQVCSAPPATVPAIIATRLTGCSKRCIMIHDISKMPAAPSLPRPA